MKRGDTIRVEVHPNRATQSLLVLVVGAYFLSMALTPEEWRWLDGVDLLIHEAGHVLFRPFGEFMMIAGGSLLQVMMPALFVGYFLRQGQPYSAALVLFWVGQSMLNVSVYAADAMAMQLPLLGGGHVIHDWNYLLVQTGLLPWTPWVAGALRGLGTLTILTGIALGLGVSHPALTWRTRT